MILRNQRTTRSTIHQPVSLNLCSSSPLLGHLLQTACRSFHLPYSATQPQPSCITMAQPLQSAITANGPHRGPLHSGNPRREKAERLTVFLSLMMQRPLFQIKTSISEINPHIENRSGQVTVTLVSPRFLELPIWQSCRSGTGLGSRAGSSLGKSSCVGFATGWGNCKLYPASAACRSPANKDDRCSGDVACVA